MQPTLSPRDFVAKWRITRSKERSTAQEHFIDLCRLLGVPTPNEADPTGDHYAFEKGANKLLGGQGWADVWKHSCFAWEYKGKHADLDKAYRQLQQYRESLLNPPLLIACDLDRIVIHTNFTNTVKRTFEVTLDDIERDDWATPDATILDGTFLKDVRQLKVRPLDLLRLAFTEFPPDSHPLRSDQTTEKVTEKAAKLFGQIAEEMQRYGENAQATAHFLIRVLFCLFAEDVGLLPANLFRDMLDASRMQPRLLVQRMRQLFQAMREGGMFGLYDIKHFDGGLFDDDAVLELEGAAMVTLRDVSALDWSAVEPSVFGTLFERGLDPNKRSQLGAHYTSRADIELIVEPVLMAPLRREWEDVKAKARELAARLPASNLQTKADHKRLAEINTSIVAFHDKLAHTRVLDPACGSGNFLYVALRALLSLEKEAITLCDELALPRLHLRVSPEQLYGIEINAYARELAQATVWIGYIQWRHENGFGFPDEPILRKLDNIRQMDAIMSWESTVDSRKSGEGGEAAVVEPEWPEAEVIIGNPPFLGDKKMRAGLGDDYVGALRRLYEGRIPGQSDLVCYWFEKARAQIEAGKARRAGLLATNSIRDGANRQALERIKQTGDIFMAWSDREWILDGAAVRVSLVGFDGGVEKHRMLDGACVERINPDLTTSADATQVVPLGENAGICFLGVMKAGPFDLDAQTAQRMLNAPANPNGRPNSDVVKRRLGGQDVTKGARDIWVIDFGVDMPLEQAAQYEMPFEYVKKHVKPLRDENRRDRIRMKWWIHGEPRPGLRRTIRGMTRCAVTPEVSKHRLFVWMPTTTVPDHTCHVIARDDDYFMGVLHSLPHEIWSLFVGSTLEDRPRYTSSRTFETFPFPWPPGREPKDDPRVQAIAQAACELVEKRDRWLAEGETPVDQAYLTGLNAAPRRPKKSEARTLTNLYNQRPTWLDLAHKKLDATVFDAYGWPHDLSDEEILSRLLMLNTDRAKTQQGR